MAISTAIGILQENGVDDEYDDVGPMIDGRALEIGSRQTTAATLP